MSEWRVCVYGVWPNLKPSSNPHHFLDMRFDSEGEARQFFGSWHGDGRLYPVEEHSSCGAACGTV